MIFIFKCIQNNILSIYYSFFLQKQAFQKELKPKIYNLKNI